MRYEKWASPVGLILAAMLLPSSSWADGGHKLDKFIIRGNAQVPTAALRAALPQQPGAVVTTDQIIADQDAIGGVYKKANVAATLKTSMATKPNGHIDVMFDIVEAAPTPQQVIKVAPKLTREEFVGNVKLKSEALAAASGLKPGDDLSNDNIQAAEKSIGAAYKTANIGVSLTGEINKLPDGGIDVVWKIVEGKAGSKPAKKDDANYLEN